MCSGARSGRWVQAQTEAPTDPGARRCSLAPCATSHGAFGRVACGIRRDLSHHNNLTWLNSHPIYLPRWLFGNLPALQQRSVMPLGSAAPSLLRSDPPAAAGTAAAPGRAVFDTTALLHGRAQRRAPSSRWHFAGSPDAGRSGRAAEGW